MFATVPSADADLRATGFRCASAAAEKLGAVALASRWPRAGLFALLSDGVGCVSLTHSKSLAAAVASRDPVGIDAEAIDRPADVVRRILAPGERDALFAAAALAGFPPALAAWCAKEAVGKALGSGLTHSQRWTLKPIESALWAADTPLPLAVRLLRHGPTLVAVAFLREKSTQTVEILVL